MKPVKVGIIGCGNISSIYLENLTTCFDLVHVEALADLVPERASEQAAKYGVKRVLTTEELLADPTIELVVNLTIPASHAFICSRALEAGKHVYVEKPLAVELEDGIALHRLAAEKGLLLGGAPDTFLGSGIQTCLDLIHTGRIGRPVAATAFMACHGHESWHPDPEFYYKVGGGPMFDMGPYYLTALFALLGPARRLTGSTAITFQHRTITSEKKNGQVIDVEIPTHIAGIMDMQNGSMAMIMTSFDVWSAKLPHIEIYGSEGTLSVPDPNTYGGPVRLRRWDDKEYEEIILERPFAENSRGLGVADMASAIRTGSMDPRAGSQMTLHVLEAMHGFHISSNKGYHYEMKTAFTAPPVLDPSFVR